MGETVFSHFQTLSAISPVYRHPIPINLPTFQHYFSYFKTQKCLEMGENVFSRFQTLVTVSPVSKHFSFLFLEPIVSRNGRFSHFQTLFVVSLVCRHVFSYFQTQKCQKRGDKKISKYILYRYTLHYYIYIININNLVLLGHVMI